MLCMKLKYLFATAVLVIFGAALVACPSKYILECYGGIAMWAESVVPSLFPFMIITSLLIATGFTEKISTPLSGICSKVKLPPSALPLFMMSCMSGYPAGSRCVAEYYKKGLIDSNDTKKLSVLCSTSGPLFIVGTVGVKAYGDSLKGYILLAVCLGTVAITSVIYCMVSPQRSTSRLLKPRESRSNLLADSFYGAVTAILLAGSFIVFFYTLSKVLADMHIFAPLEFILSPVFGQECAGALCTGIVEATGGCFALADAGGFFALPLTGFLITFGGTSIVLQQMCFLEKCGVSYSFFIFFKLAQGVVCFFVLCLVQLIFGIQ